MESSNPNGNSIEFSLETTCRTCCGIMSTIHLVPLFEDQKLAENGTTPEILDTIRLFNLPIIKDDSLPQKICINCIFEFNRIVEFRNECRRSHDKLSEYFRPQAAFNSIIIKNEPIDEANIDQGYLENCKNIELSDNVMIASNIGAGSFVTETQHELIKTETLEEDSFSPHEILTANYDAALNASDDEWKHQDRIATESKSVNSELEEGSVACELCNRKFNCSRYLKSHFDRIHERSEHECSICSKKFNSEHKYKYHMRSHDHSKLFHCETCGKSFMAAHHLQAHERVHKDIRPFKCDLCDKAYREKGNLDIHKRSHSGEKPYVCNVCGKDFAIRTSYVAHVRRHNDLANNSNGTCEFSYNCTMCTQGFNLPAQLAAHMKAHFEDRQYCCRKCGKAFYKADHLRRHTERVHLKIKRFSCGSCDMSFTLLNELKSHQIVHSDGRPFQCSMCDKSFKRKSGFVAHSRTHSGDAYTCEICKKSCKSHSRLSEHVKKHTKEERQLEQKQIMTKLFESLCTNND